MVDHTHPSSRRGDWETAAPGCDAPARSGAKSGELVVAAGRSDPDCLWRRGHARARVPHPCRPPEAAVPRPGVAPDCVEGEVEHPIADNAGGCEQPPGLVDRDDVRQALAPGWLDQTGRDPGLAQDVRVVELQPVQVELDRIPGVRCHQIGEVIGELRCGQRVNLMIKVVADAADGAGVRLDGLGLQSFELEVLEMRLVLPLKVIGGGGLHAGLSSRNIAESIPRHWVGVKVQNNPWCRSRRLLRIAASSNAQYNRPFCMLYCKKRQHIK